MSGLSRIGIRQALARDILHRPAANAFKEAMRAATQRPKTAPPKDALPREQAALTPMTKTSVAIERCFARLDGLSYSASDYADGQIVQFAVVKRKISDYANGGRKRPRSDSARMRDDMAILRELANKLPKITDDDFRKQVEVALFGA